jgi:hypothetical protein
MAPLHQYDYLFAFGTLFAALVSLLLSSYSDGINYRYDVEDAFNIGEFVIPQSD